MPRKPMVTRTLTVTVASVMCLDCTQNKTFNQVFTVPGIYTNNSILLKKIKKRYETENFKTLHVLTQHATSNLYGMTEQEFIDSAVVMSPRETSKNIKKGEFNND